MPSNKMRPRVTKQNIRNIRLFENGGSKTLIGIKDTHAFISHNLGISWKQIDKVSGSHLIISEINERAIAIIDYKTGHFYLLDGRGNSIKEFVNELEYSELSLSSHPNDSNAIFLETRQSNYAPGDDYLETVTHYYTKDGGASGFIVHGQDEYDDYALEFMTGGDYKFITGGARDLIYLSSLYGEGYVAYALNFFSESPLEFTHFPFVVHQTQDIFYAIKENKELHVSEDGVNFEHIKFPSQSPHCEPEKNTRSYIRWCLDRGYLDEDRSKRTKGSLFLQKNYYWRHGIDSEKPWITLFRYDVKRKAIKEMLEYCSDFLLVSAEEGIIIANYVTNPRECVDDREEPRIRTLITFNDGANWEPMIGPSGAEFSVNISISFWNSLGDEPNNSSMMIVCGKEGPIRNYRFGGCVLHRDDTPLSTYITKDSGRSWRKINDDVMKWMVGGGDDIIVMCSSEYKDHILYSLDSGMTWQKLAITNVLNPSSWNSSSSSHSKRFWLNIYSISFDPADQVEQSYL